jgi:hypothetical protein
MDWALHPPKSASSAEGNGFRIAFSVVVDLKRKELVDCPKRILVVCRDANSTTRRLNRYCRRQDMPGGLQLGFAAFGSWPSPWKS